MSWAPITAFLVGLGGLLASLATILKVRSDNKKTNKESVSIAEASLANAVKVVEEVYDKVTVRLNAQIDDLIGDNKLLRSEVSSLRSEVRVLTNSEEACREEVGLLRSEVKELKAAS